MAGGGGGGWTEDILILTLFEGGAAWGERGGEGGRKVPAAYNSKTINNK